MFGKDVERGAGRLAYLFILVLKGSCEEWDDALVAQAPQSPGCFGTHRRVVVGQSVPQLRNGITTNQRREGKDRTHSKVTIRAAQPLHHVAGGDGIAQLMQGLGSQGRRLLTTLLDHQSEDGRGANRGYSLHKQKLHLRCQAV